MKRFLFAGLCALAAGLSGAGSADAQCLSCSPYGCCGGLCMHLTPNFFMHGPLYNYGDGSGYAGCGGAGCGHSHGGLWGPWNHSAGCSSCGSGGSAGHGLFHGSHGAGGCDSCGSSGWGQYSRTTYVNVFARLHPTAHRCGQNCGVSCGQSTEGCSTCGGHGLAGGCSACGGHALGGLFGSHGCGADGCGIGGGHGCGSGGLFGICGNLCHSGGLCGGGKGTNLQTAPWYLYWPTSDNRFQVPSPNAAGWSGQHFVVSAPPPYGYAPPAPGVEPLTSRPVTARLANRAFRASSNPRFRSPSLASRPGVSSFSHPKPDTCYYCFGGIIHG